MRAVPVLVASLAVAPLFALDVAATDDVDCDPYPIGRCGAYDRESVIFCYKLGQRPGIYVSATETDAINVTTPGIGGPPETGLSEPKTRAYLYSGPTEAFLADPYEADLPRDTLWQENNSVAGLQVKSFRCGTWLWFAECIPQQWMGPFNIANKLPDGLVV